MLVEQGNIKLYQKTIGIMIISLDHWGTYNYFLAASYSS